MNKEIQIQTDHKIFELKITGQIHLPNVPIIRKLITSNQSQIVLPDGNTINSMSFYLQDKSQLPNTTVIAHIEEKMSAFQM